MARNPGGTVSGFKLLSTPDAPTISSVTTSIGSASVAFTAPTNVGDAAVSSYVVTAVDESSGASTGATGSASPINLSLSSGTFKIRMQAINAYGPGRLTEYDAGNVVQYSGAELWTTGKNSFGQLGDNSLADKSSPTQVGALTTWSNVATGASAYHSVATRSDGTIWCWGRGTNGELGQNNAVNRSSPVQVGVLTNWYEAATGSTFTVSVKNDGTLWSFGGNSSGTLGDGTQANKSSPVQIGSLSNWSHVACGNIHVGAVKSDGTLWTWGSNASGQLGQNTDFSAYRSSPVQVGALTDWSQVACGFAHTAAVKTGGTLWTWGRVSRGQLGLNSNTVYRSSPTQVGALTNWAQVACGAFHTVSVKTDGTLWTWGFNNRGQLGQNIATTVNRSSPVQVGALTDWSQASCGGSHTVAIKTNGTLWAWGYNRWGDFGDGTAVYRSSPVQIGALANWAQVSAGAYHTLALYGVV